jgi:CDP-diacylglycerol---glycerol-3-phosphate 3-phosphatidyltransferase
MNIPNVLTMSRLILALFFMFFLFTPGLMGKIIALCIFTAACLTDFFDGYLARKLNQITLFGQLMDPIADKVLTFSAFLSFVEMKILSSWMVILLLLREVLITGFRMLALSKGRVIPASKAGKHKTLSQLIIILVILIYLVLQELFVWDAMWITWFYWCIQLMMLFIVTITLASGINYVRLNWRI